MFTLQIKLEEVGTRWLKLDWFGCFKLVICIFTTEKFLRIHNTSAISQMALQQQITTLGSTLGVLSAKNTNVRLQWAQAHQN